MADDKKLILHVDMNSYFASVEQASDPKLKGRPVAVGGGVGGKRSIIAAASYEAKAAGVKTAMPAWEALKICPELIIVSGNMSKYLYTSSQIFKLLNQFTDQVEVFSIDEAFMDVSKTQERFGGGIAIAKQIKEQIKQRFNITCSIGISFNRFLAKLAGELQKPDGLVSLKPEDIPVKIKDVPVSTLCGVGRKLEKRLAELGIQTFGDLNQTSRQQLVKRFGPACGDQLYRMGQGQDNAVLCLENRPALAKSIGHSYTLPKATNDADEINGYLLRLCEQVGTRMRKGKYKGNVIQLSLGLSNYRFWDKQKKIADHIDDGYEIFIVAKKLMQHITNANIRFIGVTVSGMIHQLDPICIFEQAENKKRMLQAVDDINNRYGDSTIERASTLKTRLLPKSGFAARQNYGY